MIPSALARMSRQNFFFLFSMALALAAPGCARWGGSSEPISTASTPYEMAVLDSAEITQRDGRRVEVRIAQDGRADLPSGSKYVRGSSVEDFRAMISRAFPSAREIHIREFRPNRVTVLGEVFHQIHTDLSDGPMRVMDAIAAANGFTPLANRRRVRLLRQNAGSIQVFELDLRSLMRGASLDQNLLLEPGDVITVPRNFL